MYQIKNILVAENDDGKHDKQLQKLDQDSKNSKSFKIEMNYRLLLSFNSILQLGVT